MVQPDWPHCFGGDVVRRRHVLLRPGVAAVTRSRNDHRRRSTDEVRPAHVDVAEVGARGRVVGPDLLLVRERRRALLADADRAPPRRLSGFAAGRRKLRVVCPGHVDGLEALERLLLLRCHVRAEVRVVEPRAVRPREATGRGARPEGDRRVAVGDEALSRSTTAASRSGRPGRHARRAGRCSDGPSSPVYVGCIHVFPPSNEKWIPEPPTPGVNGQVVGSPALQASMSMLSLDPAARTSSLLASIATAGSFCLFCERTGSAGCRPRPHGLPVPRLRSARQARARLPARRAARGSSLIEPSSP